MIRALIVDDEPLARRGVRQLLAAHADVEVVGECRDGREALAALEHASPNLVFLDVQMPELDGFDVLRAWRPRALPMIVFVTAYEEYAVRAFETHALDYLVKPIGSERFDEALARVRRRSAMHEAFELSKRLAAMLDAPGRTPPAGLGAAGEAAPAASSAPAQRLIVPTSSGELVLDADEIDWIEADDYYAAVYARGRRHLIRESLTSLERRLDPARFVRAHRSAIVRVANVRELRGHGDGEAQLVLRDGTRVPVSRRRREHVVRAVRAQAR